MKMAGCTTSPIASTTPSEGIEAVTGPKEDLGFDWTGAEQAPNNRETDRVTPPLERRLTRKDGKIVQQRHCSEARRFVGLSNEDGSDLAHNGSMTCTCPEEVRKGDCGEAITVDNSGRAVMLWWSDEDSAGKIEYQAVPLLNNRTRNGAEETARLTRDAVDPYDIKTKWYQLLEKHGVS